MTVYDIVAQARGAKRMTEICNHLNWVWASYAGVFTALAIVAWIFRGEGPRSPLLLLLVAALACALFWLFLAWPWMEALFPGLEKRPPSILNLVVIACVLAAPVSVGAAFALARGTRLFVLAVSFGLLAANPLFPLLLGVMMNCPSND